MSEIGVRGIDLFKIAGESISGWIPSWKTGEARPTRQPFCSQMEEQLLLYLEYHPQVAWYGRGDISSAFASTYKFTTPLPTPYPIDYLFEGKAHVYLPACQSGSGMQEKIEATKKQRRRATREQESSRQLDRQREEIHPSQVLSELEALRPPPPASLRLPEAKPDPEKEYPVRYLAIRPTNSEETL